MVREASDYLVMTLSREYPMLTQEWGMLLLRPGTYERLHGDAKSLTGGNFSTQLTVRQASPSSNNQNSRFFVSLMRGDDKNFKKANLLFEIEIPTTDGTNPTDSALKQALKTGYKVLFS